MSNTKNVACSKENLVLMSEKGNAEIAQKYRELKSKLDEYESQHDSVGFKGSIFVYYRAWKMLCATNIRNDFLNTTTYRSFPPEVEQEFERKYPMASPIPSANVAKMVCAVLKNAWGWSDVCVAYRTVSNKKWCWVTNSYNSCEFNSGSNFSSFVVPYISCNSLFDAFILGYKIEGFEDYEFLIDLMKMDLDDALLTSEKARADIEEYDGNLLYDINRGHWDIWCCPTENSDGNDCLVARNPLSDIHENGLIGIDFGTKSTIVGFLDGSDDARLIRIGVGDLTKKIEAKQYENPTVLELKDFESFFQAYKKFEGRPFTKWNDCTISHTANEHLKESQSNRNFYSYFYDLKQWAGSNSGHNLKIVDQKGHSLILKAFDKIGKDDFNPIEAYAYYIGLFINNMRNGIYLDYVMSFPVNYENGIRKKIIESFSAGLKKSLPQEVLHDEAAMRMFRVRQGASEPAAYAICALQQYGFNVLDEKPVYYGVFDFGGGTTDFDFGCWRIADESKPTERKYDYVIEHMNNGGDKYLGGENLLALLAYEIFKANANLLLPNEDKLLYGISFSKPEECSLFDGSEVLVDNSQEARRNTKQLMEKLRPFWEGLTKEYYLEKIVNGIMGKVVNDGGAENQDETSDERESRNLAQWEKEIEEGVIKLDLFDKGGNRLSQFPLYLKNVNYGIDVDLLGILMQRIEKGISNFFQTLTITQHENKRPDFEKLVIFLAGNSCKSPIVYELFMKYIEKFNKDINSKNGTEKNFFELYPPLGTEDSKSILNEKGIDVNESVTAPTGKTGVVYGLLESRPGSTIKVISQKMDNDEVAFKYYVGTKRKNRACPGKYFFSPLTCEKMKYNQWMLFTDAYVEDFEIYYSSLPEVTAKQTDIKDVKMLRRRIEKSYEDEDVGIYVCAMDAKSIAYTVATAEGVKNGEFLENPVKVLLEE
ncbi:hypothetical protein [Fibrobacter sp. HC4]|uniref:hypothetical protein n=1 Tax=Fibrobacter sp. HC4 TaxID=3239812 RepID=UPI002018E483|nr:hypothetical protein [Fibrobacter succinogenes]MCL4102001.1 hypothetical protein [Fibrobacter succinogenes]